MIQIANPPALFTAYEKIVVRRRNLSYFSQIRSVVKSTQITSIISMIHFAIESSV